MSRPSLVTNYVISYLFLSNIITGRRTKSDLRISILKSLQTISEIRIRTLFGVTRKILIVIIDIEDWYKNELNKTLSSC